MYPFTDNAKKASQPTKIKKNPVIQWLRMTGMEFKFNNEWIIHPLVYNCGRKYTLLYQTTFEDSNSLL